ncbi:DNA polymerase IV [Fodinicola feengrottensis]|uniref:DNA polymerase IV n=1 Tax=Fodinicola feengrottensis TaxID=435914 RepID=A0ABN2HRV0_9ACTN
MATKPGEVGDDTGCTILHVDMDAFFVSVELRTRPELRGKPVVVGGTGGRGVVSSASYEARAFGVRSAMPTGVARRLCPNAVFLPVSHGAYGEVSRDVMAIFADVTPMVEQLSVDEAFLDVTGAVRLLGPPASIAEQIRRRVEAEQHITCSVGVASTKFIAKLASSLCKPDGKLVVPKNSILEFLHPLPVGALWGVGQRTEEILTRAGCKTVGDVAAMPLRTLQKTVGAAAGAHLFELANGRDPRRVSVEEHDKSIGSEETFDIDVTDHRRMHKEILHLATKVGERLRSSGYSGRTVSIKVRFADFKTITRSRTLHQSTDSGHEIYATARGLYDALRLDQPRIRLIGVRVEHLGDGAGGSEQLMFGDPDHGWRDAEQAVDAAAKRFGSGAIRPATLVPRKQAPNKSEPAT